MAQRKLPDVGSVLRRGARDLRSSSAWVWERARAQGAKARSRATSWVANRAYRGPAVGQPVDRAVDAENMTKDELMDLARKEDVRGRSSMTKAQLAAALRKVRES